MEYYQYTIIITRVITMPRNHRQLTSNSQTEQKQIDNAIDGVATIERIKKINALLDQYLKD